MLVLPIAFIRWNIISKCNISPLTTVADISMYSLSGALNALLLLFTLSDLLFRRKSTGHRGAAGLGSNVGVASTESDGTARVLYTPKE